jgi:hypothetical protein
VTVLEKKKEIILLKQEGKLSTWMHRISMTVKMSMKKKMTLKK